MNIGGLFGVFLFEKGSNLGIVVGADGFTTLCTVCHNFSFCRRGTAKRKVQENKDPYLVAKAMTFDPARPNCKFTSHLKSKNPNPS